MRGEPEANPPRIGAIADPLDQIKFLRPVHELGCRMRPDQQRISDVADGRTFRDLTASDRKHQLVLGVRQPVRLGSLAAPRIEAPQRDAEPEESLVLRITGHTWSVLDRRAI